MGSLGFGELLVIFLLVLLIFGAGRLPALAGSLGTAIRRFRGELRDGDAKPGERQDGADSGGKDR